MNPEKPLKILLIEDDEDDYIILRDLLSRIRVPPPELDWAASYKAGIREIRKNRHDVYLLDYRLGKHDGLTLLKTVTQGGFNKPIIFFTGQGNYDVDMEAMKSGAADFLVKGQIDSQVLERCIRYAIERYNTQQALRKSEQELRSLSLQLLSAQENERKYVATELHDSISQTMAAIKHLIENALELFNNGETTRGRDSLHNVNQVLLEALAEVRKIYMHLHPYILDDLGILATLRWYCREFKDAYAGLNFDIRLNINEDQIPSNVKIVIFRIVQEALSNIGKHSRADRVRIALDPGQTGIELLIEDNGRGFDLQKVLSKNPLGLMIMKERARYSGGEFDIRSAVRGGTVIRANWPVTGQ